MNIADELMVGNLINYAGDVCEVNGVKYIDEHGHQRVYLKGGGAKKDFLSPISITETWIIVLGFNRKDTASRMPYYWLRHGEIEIGWDEHGFDLIYPGSTISLCLPHIKYVHQIQNFYFAMTGEKLKIG